MIILKKYQQITEKDLEGHDHATLPSGEIVEVHHATTMVFNLRDRGWKIDGTTEVPPNIENMWEVDDEDELSRRSRAQIAWFLAPRGKSVVLVPPPLRNIGTVPRRDVRAGEAFMYPGPSGTRYLIGIAAGFTQTHVDPGRSMDDLVDLIPGPGDSKPRISGKLPKNRVQVNEAFKDATGKKFYFSPSVKKYDDSWTVTNTLDDRDVSQVELIPPPDFVSTVEASAPKHKHMNSGRLYNFESGVNSFTGQRGWKPVELSKGSDAGKGFDPVAPVMVIHDLMEHFPEDEYGPHAEYMAQGAMLWLRFEGKFFANIPDMAEKVVKPAFGMLYHHISKDRLETRQFTGAPTSDGVVTDGNPFNNMKRDTAYALSALIEASRKYTNDQIGAIGSSSGERIYESLFRGIPWIVQGYVRAERRYAGLDKQKLIRLYKDAVAAIGEPVDERSSLTLSMRYEKYTADVSKSTRVNPYNTRDDEPRKSDNDLPF